MPNTIKTISLTDDDKSYLNKLLTQSTLEIRVYQRARILLLKSEGASNKAIADKLDIGISVVKRCLNKFKENGVEASLRDNKGRGRKAEITDDDITWVNITVRQSRQSGVARFFRNYPLLLLYPMYLNFASSNCLPHLPYIVRFIIFNLLLVPSTNPLL